MGLSVALALAATTVAHLHGGPTLLYALLFGVALHHLSRDALTRRGIEFCSRTVLRLGVGLLGARITAQQIVALGWTTALTVVVAIVLTLLFALVLGRFLNLTRAQSVLCGGAVAICGASAALAISAVLPREKHGDRFTLTVVVAVTLLSTLAMVFYPLLTRALDWTPEIAGIFIGATIHDVAQVVGAGYTLGPVAGDVATVVKMLRVSLLAVVVVGITFAFRGTTNANDHDVAEKRPERQPMLPWFLWMFIVMVGLNSIGGIAPGLQGGLNEVSRACLAIAISALGLKTSMAQLARTGLNALLMVGAETLWLAAIVGAMIALV
ncbi:MAG: putative sulfate exporter family transporter [Rubrivivax sp.]